MKLKTAKIIVEPVEQTNDKWKRALSEKLKSKPGQEVISVAGWDTLGKVLSPPRLQILAAIPVVKPKSIAELARALDKDFKNVHSDVKFLADLGLIELKEKGLRKTLVPKAKFSRIELPLAA